MYQRCQSKTCWRECGFFIFLFIVSYWICNENWKSFFSAFVKFLLYHQKKVLDSWKFSTSGFWWIYMIWDALNTIWPLLENVCLSVCRSPKFCGNCISGSNARKLMKLYIQLHLDKIWFSLDFACISFKKFWCCSKFLISLTQ